MAVQELMDSLRNFDTEQFDDLDRLGSWPLPIRVILWSLASIGVLAAGYFIRITDLQDQLDEVRVVEGQLRSDYEQKYSAATHLEDYLARQKEMQASFAAVLRQLPSDAEIPGLIEDITQVGLENGLVFERMDLQPESEQEFYIEKPIRIVVHGGYHGLGYFVSGVASLPRLVTLHDFSISPGDRRGDADAAGELLRMRILAKTYRYKEGSGD